MPPILAPTLQTNPRTHALTRPCPPQAAGSILGAQALASGGADIAVHWGGGMHHGHPTKAYGFCYVNDLVRREEVGVGGMKHSMER